MVPASAARPSLEALRRGVARFRDMSDQPLHLHRGGPPETVLPDAPADARAALAAALEDPEPEARLRAVASVAARWPRFLDAWATLGELTDDPVTAYAFFRVAYHRGLDQLRAAGWRGSGYVRWVHDANRGFLRGVDGLRRAAAAIGETDEEARCVEFLAQLDPSRAAGTVEYRQPS